jgi:hypothetical protein
MTDEEKVAQVRRETEMKMTDEIKTKLTAEEQEAMHKLISSTEPRDDLEAVDLWYVMGIGGTYYGTKMQAEAEARKAFPKEDAVKRYGRVYYKTFYQEV